VVATLTNLKPLCVGFNDARFTVAKTKELNRPAPLQAVRCPKAGIFADPQSACAINETPVRSTSQRPARRRPSLALPVLGASDQDRFRLTNLVRLLRRSTRLEEPLEGSALMAVFNSLHALDWRGPVTPLAALVPGTGCCLAWIRLGFQNPSVMGRSLATGQNER